MLAPRLALLPVLLLLVLRGGLGTPPDLTKPPAAVALVQPEGALIAWTPPPIAPDYFVVYGIVGENKAPISIAPASAAFTEVDAVYPQYAIAAVVGDTPSETTLAVTIAQACVTIETSSIPPVISLGCEGTNIPGKVGVEIVLHGLP